MIVNNENILKKTALELNHSLDEVELIVKDSFKNAVRVLSNTDISEVEIAGFGKLRMSEVKLRKRLDRYYGIKQMYDETLLSYLSNKDTLTEQEYRKLNKRIISINKDISNLERKYLRINKIKQQNLN